MKKLMIATAAMAILGSASAVTVYDYRATVKHPYLKEVSVRPAGGGAAIKVYAKFVKSSTLKGYLIQDEEAVLNGGKKTTALVGAATITGPAAVPQPENRCFLVAINSGAGKYAYPRIIPGIIEAKWYNPTCKTAKSVQAQGYLWLGGELALVTAGAGLQTIGGFGMTDGTPATFEVIGHKNAPQTYVAPTAGAAVNTLAGLTAGAGAQVWNYAFTSEYLFGQFNQKAGTALAFADTWMNGAGFGTAGAFDTRDACCGWGTGDAGIALDGLQGNLKGGVFVCSENGDDKNHTHPFGGINLLGAPVAEAPSQFERQLWASYDVVLPTTGGTGIFAAGDQARYNDLWVDGPFALTTTDCISGTWSIRRVTKDMTAALATTAGGEDAVFATAASLAAWTGIGAVPSDDRAGSLVGSYDGTLELLETIKGCMKALSKNAKMAGGDTDAAPNNAKVPTALFGPTFYNAYLAQ